MMFKKNLKLPKIKIHPILIKDKLIKHKEIYILIKLICLNPLQIYWINNNFQKLIIIFIK